MTPEEIIKRLDLKPHPEGGWFRETFCADAPKAGRAAVTAIYYLLKAGERSHWHRVRDADEIWTWHSGGPLRLSICAEGGSREIITLGADLAAGQRPQSVVGKDIWQSADPLGEWSLVSCVVAPGFSFAGFELAPPDWEPDNA